MEKSLVVLNRLLKEAFWGGSRYTLLSCVTSSSLHETKSVRSLLISIAYCCLLLKCKYFKGKYLYIFGLDYFNLLITV